jgi:hypothetical protein
MRQKHFIGGIVKAIAPTLIGGVAKKVFGGDKGGASTAQQPQTQRQDNTFENFMAMQIDESRRKDRVLSMAQATQGANEQIAAILQRELQNAYRDPQAAAQRIFGDYT